ncbi:MAG: DNA-binding protein [Planctomycetia bacterium]|nr:DNA-binding protein [Planctomycetia bacterium]
MNRTDLQQLADVRIDDAAALLALPVPRTDSAYYLAGYAVECALKACIAKRYNQHDWPEKEFVNKSHTHNLASLLALANLDVALEADAKANHVLDSNWTIVKDWNEQSRYERHSEAKAQELINAIVDNANGVLPWIKARW